MTHRRSKLPFLIIAFLVIALALRIADQHGLLQSAKHAAVSNQPGLYSVTRFVDGDTIAVNMNGTIEKVRFVGVDTPETHKPNTPIQCYGPAAAAFTKSQIGTQKIRLVSDELSTDRDRYGRLLRYVYLADGTNVNEKLIQTGHGFFYPYFPFSKSNQFASDQKTAMAAHLGVWGNCSPAPTDQGGFVSNPQ